MVVVMIVAEAVVVVATMSISMATVVAAVMAMVVAEVMAVMATMVVAAVGIVIKKALIKQILTNEYVWTDISAHFFWRKPRRGPGRSDRRNAGRHRR